MKSISLLFFTILFAFAPSCAEKKKPDKNDIEKMTSLKNVQILSERLYHVQNTKAASELQNVIVLKSDQDLYQMFATKKNGMFELINLRKVGANIEFIKQLFLNPEIGFSHSLLILKENNAHYLLLMDTEHLQQKIMLSENDMKNLYMKKNEKKPFDEIIFAGEKMYRFDSFSYVEVFDDSPLPFLLVFKTDNENSLIEMINRGAYTSRAVITISFPDLDGKKTEDYLRLTKDIPTVKLYNPGQKVFHASRKYISSQYPMIEITKEPFGRNVKMHLPLFMSPEIGRVMIRAVASIRGSIEKWPSQKQLNSDVNVAADQQGYPAYIYNKKHD